MRRMRRHNTRGEWLALASAAGTVLAGLKLRSKLRSVPALEPATDEPDSEHLFITARRVHLDAATRRAASAHARREALDVVDLIPGDLDVERALEFLRWTDPATFRTDRLALNRGPAQALLVSRDVARRADLDTGHKLEPAQVALAAERAKKHAPTGSDYVVAPDLRSRRPDRVEYQRLLRAVLDFGARPYLVADAAAGLVAGVAAAAAVRRRKPRLAAPLVAYSLQPLLVFAGSRLRPRELARSSAGRWPRRLGQIAAALHAGVASTEDADRVDVLRPTYEKLLAGGTERFFESRRSDCWFCAGTNLSVVVSTSEYLQCKPGHFVLERCNDCGHVFQNPPLSTEGLEFYYRDYYDGLGERPIELLFGAQVRTFRARAEMMRDLAEPTRWMDVGADRGQFCLAASEVWPATRFDGLDMSDGIEEAERRGCVERAHRGQLVDLADQLADAYDVVSMCHYLEHTRDPRAELDAATTLLRTGGHLLVEVPDPEFPLARLLGNYWGSWLPMQHLHFLPLRNLERLLVERGYEVVRRERGAAHVIGADFVWAAYLVLQRLAPPLHFPWLPPPTPQAKLRRLVGLGLFAPVLTVALAADFLLTGLARITNRSNAYRVVARKVDGSTSES